MKILQINTVCGSGSTGRIAVDLYKLNEQSGGEGAVLYGRRNAPLEVNTIRMSNSLDMFFHVMKNFFRGKSGFGSVRETKKALRKIEEYDPDIIHLHNIHGFYLNAELLFAYLKQAGKPVIWTLHDCWSFTGHCAYFDYVGCDKWKTGCHHCEQHRKAYPYSLFYDNSKWSYEKKKEIFTRVPRLTLVTPSEWLKKLAEQSFLKEYPIEVIHNGIDLQSFYPQESDLRQRYHLEQKYVILGVANIWEKRKGLDFFAALSERLGEKEQIVLIGLSEKQIRQLPKSMTGISRTENISELAQWYSLADVYVNTTLEENFPTTNLEALACGTPVVTFATGGSVESVNETCGRIVEKGNLDALFQALLELKEAPVTKEACIKQGRSYDKYVRFQEYMELYRNSLGAEKVWQSN